jgi:site-specific recombinase XerD
MDVLKQTITITETITLEMAIETFMQIETEELAEESQTWYRKRLGAFNAYMGKGRNIISILEIDLFSYSKFLKDKKLSPHTRHGHIRILKRFFKFLQRRNILPLDISKDLKLPKLPKNAKKGINEKNVSLILKSAKENSRDYALLNFLESTSARRKGIADLKLSNMNLDSPEPYRRRVIIHEKGNKDRTVVMSKETYKAIRNYLATRESNSDFVFVGENGKPLTVWGITEILERYKRRLQIKEPCSPHQWRHRWCRKRIQEHMPLKQVSQLAGHASIQVTADFYGTFADDELAEAFDRYYKPPDEI